MEQGTHEEREAALRPLRTIGKVIADLRRGSLAAEEERSAIIQVASAVEMSLRRVLRDHPDIAIPVRLRALAPDELGPDEVLAELRQHDRISIDLAAAVHDLLELRRRLKEGAPVGPNDGTSAYRVADRLEREVSDPLPPESLAEEARPATVLPGAPPVEAPPAAGEAPEVEEEDADQELPSRWSNRNLYLVAGGLLLLLLLPLGYWLATRQDTSELDQGIALFRTAAYADAANHFYRYAQENPGDPVPHLYLARIHRRLKRYDLAAPELSAALRLAPDDPAVYAELGFLLTDTQRYDQAVSRFRQALRLDPENQQAWIGLVRALRVAGQHDAAARVLTSAPPEVRAMLARPASAADTAAI